MLKPRFSAPGATTGSLSFGLASSQSAEDAKSALTRPFEPILCERGVLELAGIPGPIIDLACVPDDRGELGGRVRPVVPIEDAFRELTNLRIAEDPDLRPYLWEQDECR